MLAQDVFLDLAGRRHARHGCKSQAHALKVPAIFRAVAAAVARGARHGGRRLLRHRNNTCESVLYEAVWLLDLVGGSQAAIGSLSQALEAANGACTATAAARQVGIAIDDVPEVQIGIETDRLTLVLVNLIDNAVKHGRPGGGVFVGIDLGDRRFVRITVDDDGPGVVAADRERIFALGGRAETAADGNGIGLALVRLMLERAGGRVDLTDSPLGGARFTITIARASDWT
jgi:signal transduction histidine kinase